MTRATKLINETTPNNPIRLSQIQKACEQELNPDFEVDLIKWGNTIWGAESSRKLEISPIEGDKLVWLGFKNQNRGGFGNI